MCELLRKMSFASRRMRRLVPALVVAAIGLGLALPAVAQTDEQNRRQPAAGQARRPIVKPTLSLADRQSLSAVYKTARRLRPFVLNLANPAHRAFFLAERKAAGITPENNPAFADFMRKAQAYYSAAVRPKSGFVFLVNGKLQDEDGAPINGPVGPVLTITSFQTINNSTVQYGVSGLVSLPGQPQTCTQTLQVFDENNNPQGPADINTQTLACESSLLYAEGQLDPSDKYASAHLVAHGISQAGTPFAYAALAEGSSIPTQIVSTNPNDLNHDGMIKFCFGRTAPDCDYAPTGTSQQNVNLPINGNTSWDSALLNPATDPNASVYIAITQPQPQTGGGCNLVANVQQFLQQSVTLSNNNKTVNWNNTAVQFPAINSTCMPNGSIVYYNMSMNVDLATNVPTFFGISSSPDTPISTGFYLMLAPTRIYYSCLAADARIALADGSFKAIADVRAGDIVVGGEAGAPLKVASVYVGTEEQPLVHFTTRNGLELKVTQGHPVMTEHGVRLARFLEVGDVVLTADGDSPIATLDRVGYAGKVYNLSLAAMQPGLKIAPDQELFYANGVLVGGNEMQWRYDRKDAQVVATALPPPMPHISDAARALLAKRFGPQAVAR